MGGVDQVLKSNTSGRLGRQRRGRKCKHPSNPPPADAGTKHSVESSRRGILPPGREADTGHTVEAYLWHTHSSPPPGWRPAPPRNKFYEPEHTLRPQKKNGEISGNRRNRNRRDVTRAARGEAKWQTIGTCLWSYTFPPRVGLFIVVISLLPLIELLGLARPPGSRPPRYPKTQTRIIELLNY